MKRVLFIFAIIRTIVLVHERSVQAAEASEAQAIETKLKLE